MPHNHSVLSYADCRGAFEKAISSPKGIRIPCATPGKATILQHRLHTFRAMLRRESAKIYSEDHPMFGQSPYEKFVVKKIGSIVSIEPVDEDSLAIEEIE